MSKRLPPIESLRILEACVRNASFTRAAHEIGITPAAVSLRMRNLEAEVGTLFTRSGPRLEPTRAARALAAQLAEALSLIQAAVADCRGRMPSLRLTTVPSFATHWLAPRLARYHERTDSVPIQLDAAIELRTTTQFDMAIRTGRGSWPDFDVTQLMPVELTPMVSPALMAGVRLRSPTDLASLPLLPHDDWPSWFRSAGTRTPRLRFCADEYPTYELDAMAAVAGAGAALLSPTLFAPLLSEGKLAQPFAQVMRGPSWHYLLLEPHDTRAAVLGFRAWLQSELEECQGATR